MINRKKIGYNVRMEKYDVKVFWDDEADIWIAACDDVPLTLYAETIELLMEDVRETALEIFELESKPTEDIAFTFQVEERYANVI